MIKPVLGSQLKYGHPLARGLVGYWLINEGSGSIINDLSGNGNTGTLLGPTWKAGKFGPALDFEEDNSDYVVLPDTLFDKFTGATGITIITSLKRGSTEGANSHRVFSMPLSGALVGSDKIHFEFDDDKLEWQAAVARGDEGVITSAGTFTDTSAWLHIACTADLISVSNNLNFYLNGVLNTTGSKNYTTKAFDSDWRTGLSALNISSRENAPARDRYFDGLIEYFYLFNRALSAFEIAKLYQYPFCMFKDPAEIALLGGNQGAPPETIVPQIQYLRNMGVLA